jgi:hypothetical protein
MKLQFLLTGIVATGLFALAPEAVAYLYRAVDKAGRRHQLPNSGEVFAGSRQIASFW